MSTVTVAAAALDTAIAGFQSALTTYVNACATANSTYRGAHSGQSNHRLENSVEHVFGILLTDRLTATVVERDQQRPVPSLATIHALD